MTSDPINPRQPGSGTTRRTFMQRAATAAAGLSVPGLLAACGTTSPTGGSGSSSSATTPMGPGGLPLARPNHPVTLPIYADNKAIASGLSPEKGPLQFYNWDQYINTDVVKAFEKKYGVKVQISTFTTIDEAVAKISSGTVQFDVFVPELVFLERLVVGKVLQPLNLSYVPNLTANVWPSLHSPWYDVGARYTVPYTIYTTGIGWRADKLPGFDPATMENPWSASLGGGPEDLRQGRAARRPARGPRDGPAAQRRHRRQHRGPEADQRLQERAGQPDQHRQPEVRHQRVPAPGRRLTVAAPGVVGRHGVDAVLRAEGHQGVGVPLLVARGRARSDQQRHVRRPQGRQEPGPRPPVPEPSCSTPSRCSTTSTSPTTSSRSTR